jgi:hypothetical protein
VAFSKGYIADFAKVWDEEGIKAVRHVAKKNPTAFLGIASKLIPQQVTATIETQLPWKLEPRGLGGIAGDYGRDQASAT